VCRASNGQLDTFLYHRRGCRKHGNIRYPRDDDQGDGDLGCYGNSVPDARFGQLRLPRTVLCNVLAGPNQMSGNENGDYPNRGKQHKKHVEVIEVPHQMAGAELCSLGISLMLNVAQQSRDQIYPL
jgi:hypothetical protein